MGDKNLYVRREKRKRNQLRYVKKASFESYIRKLLRNLSGQGRASISEPALAIINDMIKHFFTDLSLEATELMTASKKRTLTAWDIQDAVRATLKGEVANHAISEGQKAVTMYIDMTRQG
ncbi:histone H2B-like [Argiope bruennichi]|uniref:Histone H2B like protein n=1 Tax=Argiope bruennichi TaxID=94029 RepID=A0A8T0E7F1_ARGBR|nr:histone H2B-like [Argiope bruennichi]KAF8767703.1 Histone H2B like protein [Argiope bruennichi]